MLNKRVLSNIFSLLVLQGANYILPLITLPYLVITLGVEKFGILAFALAIIRYFNILIDYGFNLSATREISTQVQNKDIVSKIFSSVILIKTILLIISFIFLTFILYFSDSLAQYKNIYYFTFLSLVGNVLFPVWYFQGIQKMKYITIINILSKTIFTLFIFLLIKNSNDYIYVPLINSIGVIIGGIIAFTIALKDINLTMPSFIDMKKVFNDSTSLFISNVSVTLFTASNVFILGLFASDAIVGIYSSIERLIMAVKNLYVPLYQGIFPWLANKKKTEIALFIKKILPFISIGSFILTLFIMIFSKQILSLIYHNETITQYSYILQIFSLISILSASNMLFNYLYLNATKNYKIRMNIFLISGIFNVSIGTILVKFFGILGITISVVLTEILLLFLGIKYFIILTNKETQ